MFPESRTGARARGFTLIELLVVIAIIALLAAILFPVFGRARENARRSSCQSNLKQIALGFHQYTQDYDEKMPLPGYGQPATNTTNLSAWQSGADKYYFFTWVDEIYPYIKNGQVFICPSDRNGGRYATSNQLGQISYGMNSYLNGIKNAYIGPRLNDNTIAAVGQPLSGFTSASYKVLAGDFFHESGYAGVMINPLASTYGDYYYSYPLDMECDTSGVWCGGTVGWKKQGRHLGGANVAFCDGHVKFMPKGTPGIQFSDSGTCGTGSNGNYCNVYYGTNEFIRFYSPYADAPL